MTCRFCQTELTDVFVDLFNSPASNSFLSAEQLNEPENFFPLKIYTCSKCFLVQVDEYKKSDTIFDSSYVYFSSYSTTWLQHAKKYVEKMIDRFGYNSGSQVVEIASNDGYLLQYFVEKKVPVLGIEPTANTAEVAKTKGVESVVDFFGVRLAKELSAKGTKADLLLGNNVLAHVPDIVDFTSGLKVLLNDKGVVTMEFPHLVQLMENNQFDTIYHEHFSYLSFTTVAEIFKAAGLEMFDVEEIPTHGGSLRIYAKHAEDGSKQIESSVAALLAKEEAKGIKNMSYYSGFQQAAMKVKTDFLDFLVQQKRAGSKVAAYGAAAKGNTLLNYCGVKADLVSYVVDANPHKQNKFLPGSHIPVVKEAHLKQDKPDYVIIFPWNIKDEVMAQLAYIRDWGGKFVIAIPGLKID
ncbi:class I SAM-dependent methyltransferase [Terrimonas sp. NA20]|uniref:Class I SAM-dependent methyltransferase n=1 Tax=Terrimonas ginsenosidimutans TaxID=2908004 RepID=A0ABS9KSX5_9BACT|nr:class I SAM-dependent methyltransferase [Terrimonas ginsenosidimutans]MCG2615400.1 class I SAM-dependent methyltransferase [Terrimonas ginsenosidimutans]